MEKTNKCEGCRWFTEDGICHNVNAVFNPDFGCYEGCRIVVSASANTSITETFSSYDYVMTEQEQKDMDGKAYCIVRKDNFTGEFEIVDGNAYRSKNVANDTMKALILKSDVEHIEKDMPYVRRWFENDVDQFMCDNGCSMSSDDEIKRFCECCGYDFYNTKIMLECLDRLIQAQSFDYEYEIMEITIV